MKFFAVVMIYLLSPWLAQAATTLSLQGRILKADGTPLLAASVQFKIQVRSPGAEDCLLYQEIQTLDMTASGGVFAVNIGSATATRPGAGVDGNFTLAQVFANRGSFDLSGAPGACGVGSTFTPGSASDHRKLYYEFNDGSGWEIVPAVVINWAPYAIEAQQVSGFKAANLLRAVDVSGNPASVSAFIPTEMAELLALINGTSTRYVQPSSNTTFSSTITFSNAPQFGGVPTGANDLTNKTYVDSAVASALPNVGTAGTYYKVQTDAKGRVTSGASSLVAADIPNLDAAKITTGSFSTPGMVSGNAITSGTISGSTGINTSGNITTTGTFTGSVVSGGIVSANQLRVYNGANYVQFTAPVLGGNINWILPNADGAPGQVLKTDGSGNLSWINGSAGSVTNVTTGTGLSGGVITSTGTISLANTSVAAGSYGTSTSVPAFNVDAQGRLTGASAIAIPTANTTTTGLITSADWNIFNGKVNKAGDTMTGLLVLSADPAVNLGSSTKQYVDSSTATAAANYIRKDGTVAFTAAQSMGSNKLTFVTDPTSAQDAATKNYADTKFITKNLPAAPAAGQDGQSLRWNNGTLAWEYYSASSISGSGTTNYLPKFTSTSAIGNSLIYDDGTNVGIGTTVPSQKLHVNGSTLFGAGNLSFITPVALNLNNSAANTLKTQLNIINTGGGANTGSAIDFYTYDTSAADVAQPGLRIGAFDNNWSADFTVSTKIPGSGSNALSERFRITNAGKVGIGTATPAYALDVSGGVRSLSGGFTFPDGTTQSTSSAWKFASKSANFTVVTSDANTIFLNSNATIATLPSAASAGANFKLKFVTSDANTLRLSFNGTDQVNGNVINNIFLTAQNSAATLISDGTQWYVMDYSGGVVFNCLHGSASFATSGSSSYTMPTYACTSVTVKIWGGGGGAGGYDGGTIGGNGGGGAYASSVLTIANGTVLTIQVAGAGNAGAGGVTGTGGGAAAYGGGAAGGNGGSVGNSGAGGGGGGASSILNGATVLALAAGGAGGGGGGAGIIGGAGGGGGVSGTAADGVAGATAASGTSTGIAGTTNASDTGGGGGGGGGILGGGGGAYGATGGGGGGGGGGSSLGSTVQNGSGTNAGNQFDALRINAGQGGIYGTSGGFGAAGLVSISW